MDAERFGRRVRAFRKLKRLQQVEFAKRVEISTTSLGRIERGEKRPSPELMTKIAEQLDINEKELIGEE